MASYVPPARRAQGQGFAADALPPVRQSERIWAVQLHLSKDNPTDLSTCPEHILTSADEETAQTVPGVRISRFELPSSVSAQEAAALLKWFHGAATVKSDALPRGDPWAALIFPPTLSKEDRKMLHNQADCFRLNTASQGVGEERFLTIRSMASARAASRSQHTSTAVMAAAAPPGAAGAGGDRGHPGAPEAAEGFAGLQLAKMDTLAVPGPDRARARQIFQWCQQEGGRFFEYSHSELIELVASGRPLPPDLQTLVTRKELGLQLLAAIEARDEARALQLISQEPAAAWTRQEPANGSTSSSGGRAGHGWGRGGGSSGGGFTARAQGGRSSRGGRFRGRGSCWSTPRPRRGRNGRVWEEGGHGEGENAAVPRNDNGTDVGGPRETPAEPSAGGAAGMVGGRSVAGAAVAAARAAARASALLLMGGRRGSSDPPATSAAAAATEPTSEAAAVPALDPPSDPAAPAHTVLGKEDACSAPRAASKEPVPKATSPRVSLQALGAVPDASRQGAAIPMPGDASSAAGGPDVVCPGHPTDPAAELPPAASASGASPVDVGAPAPGSTAPGTGLAGPQCVGSGSNDGGSSAGAGLAGSGASDCGSMGSRVGRQGVRHGDAHEAASGDTCGEGYWHDDGSGAGRGRHGSGSGISYYPVHLAAELGLQSVVAALAAIPGVVDQRDGAYSTPLKVARRAGHEAVVEVLRQHGAVDAPGQGAVHKVAAAPDETTTDMGQHQEPIDGEPSAA